MFFRLKELQQSRIQLQFSQTWEENIYMEGKGFLPKAHSSVHCPKGCFNGVNPRDLSNHEMASFSIIQSLCLDGFSLVSAPFFMLWPDGGKPLEAARVLVDQLVLFIVW